MLDRLSSVRALDFRDDGPPSGDGLLGQRFMMCRGWGTRTGSRELSGPRTPSSDGWTASDAILWTESRPSGSRLAARGSDRPTGR